MQVRILPSAKLDLEDGMLFYEEQDAGVGLYFLKSLSTDIEPLENLAGIHRQRDGLFRFMVKKFPYWIYYRMEDDVVFVVGVLDARQDPATISKRESEMD